MRNSIAPPGSTAPAFHVSLDFDLPEHDDAPDWPTQAVNVWVGSTIVARLTVWSSGNGYACHVSVGDEEAISPVPLIEEETDAH